MRFCRQVICMTALMLTAGGANAQSSVTLYGIADAFVQFLNNDGKSSWSQRSGGSSPSRFGLKGTESGRRTKGRIYARKWFQHQQRHGLWRYERHVDSSPLALRFSSVHPYSVMQAGATI